MSSDRRTRKFVFGNERFGGSYTPGEFEINFPDDMSTEDFERMFSQKMEALHKKGKEFHEKYDKKSKRQNLKPLSIRVKPHTKEFFKDQSILSPREVLEIYEEFNNGSEAFINSLLEEERQLEIELTEIQEKLHNAKLFKEKLGDLKPQNEVLTDEDKLLKLKQQYEKSEVKEIGNEISLQKAKDDIINDIQLYNTVKICVYDNQVLSIGVYTDAQPVVYYLKNEYPEDDVEEILECVEKYCSENEIAFTQEQDSLFAEE